MIFSCFLATLRGILPRCALRRTSDQVRCAMCALLVGVLAMMSMSIAQAKAPAVNASDEVVLGAHEAFRKNDAARVARYAANLRGHVLEPYVDFWKLKLRMDETPPAEIRAYLSRWPDTYPADRLRAEWLKVLAQRGEWAAVESEAANLQVEDADSRCWVIGARWARADAAALEAARAYFFEPRDLPEGCVTPIQVLFDSGKLSSRHVWERFRLLMDAGQTNAARRALGWLPTPEAPPPATLHTALTAPARLLAHPPEAKQRASQEMLLLALTRVAAKEPQDAANSLQGRLAERFSAADRAYAWSRIAVEGARKHLPASITWFERGGETALNEEQLAWKVRAALRAGNWPMVMGAIDAMPVSAHNEAAWSYWYARGLAAQGKMDGARAYWLRIAGRPEFYGILASEELGQRVGVPAYAAPPTAEELSRMRAVPGLARTFELLRLNLRLEGVREWAHTLRNRDDRDLLAAAQIAVEAQHVDRAISAADRTQQQHDFRLRYLAPFRDQFQQQASATGIEEAWLLGLTRQESRFITTARSSVGAQGLMQLMPTTATWIARKSGYTHFSMAKLHEVPTNVALGSRYLKLLLEDLKHPVLASAAYNAGPGRARRWRDAKPLEGAIYAENIPFTETRDYVKKVMSNTIYYALLLEGRSMPLKQRLNTIAARAVTDKFNEELP